MKDSHVAIVDPYTMASPSERVLAALIDLVVYALLHVALSYGFGYFGFSWAGAALAPFYIILKDSFRFSGRKSLGKKIFNLRVIKNDNKTIRWYTSALRNFIYAGFFLNIWGRDFIFVSGSVTFVLLVIETYLMMTSDDNLRLGDHLAGTQVVEDENA